MACYHPLPAWRPRSDNATRSLSFQPLYADAPHIGRIFLSCGQCVGCRLEYSRQWAVRCMHEASLYEDNCFITLTYGKGQLPAGGTLVKADFQKFMKRLREQVYRKFQKSRFRYYYCGEYGENFGRPHYHALIFNFDFDDKYEWRHSSSGHALYRSPFLESVWTAGHSEIGSVTFDSAAYVARYVMKKRTGDAAADWYKREYVDKFGIIHEVNLLPEFTDMSRSPGIGKPWLDKFHSDVYNGDFVLVNGAKARPPRYYDNAFEILYPDEMELIKQKRVLDFKRRRANNTVDRLRVREAVALAKFYRSHRGL